MLSEEVGTPLRAQSLHGWMQEVGEAGEARELTPAAPSASSPQAGREVVVVEGDATMLRSQQAGERQFAMKLGNGSSQKERQGAKRWRLTDKVVSGGVEEPGKFAERFYVRREAALQVERAPQVVVKGDGAEWICQGAAQVFPGQVFQLDRWHLLDRLAQFAGHLPRLWKRLPRWVYQGRVTARARSLRHWVGVDRRSEQARLELRGYVTRHAQAITAVDRLGRRVSPQARPLLTHGTGAMEKNSATVIGRRFQRWGRRWTPRGAHHRLQLRRWIARCGTTWFEALNTPPAQRTNA